MKGKMIELKVATIAAITRAIDKAD